MSEIRNTIKYLETCRSARAQGYPVSFTTDPSWLVNMAINQRAGWQDDPSHTRGSAMPLPDGRYPARASGQAWSDTRHVAPCSEGASCATCPACYVNSSPASRNNSTTKKRRAPRGITRSVGRRVS